MATLEENKKIWELDVIWECGGEEWSKIWGGPYMHWHASVFPRIFRFLPTDTILEIGSGYGRFSYFLKDYAKNLILVDFSKNGIEGCKARFADENHIQYFVNDGQSLEMIPDNSIDFACSFDALVFIEEDVMDTYIRQLAKKLKKDGSIFMHHSNLGEYWYYTKLSDKTIKRLQKLNILGKDHWRSRSVSANKVKEICNQYGLECITQELVLKETTKTFVDCYSVIVRKDSKWYKEPKVFRNKDFPQEAQYTRRLSKYYGLPYEKRYNSPASDIETLLKSEVTSGLNENKK